jgi:hypothetical protein
MFIALHIFSSKNSWSSPLGGLYFSFNCTCREAKNLPFIQYVICLAVIEAISREASSVLLENGITSGFIENLKIKWPNDIYYKNIKVRLKNSVFYRISYDLMQDRWYSMSFKLL